MFVRRAQYMDRIYVKHNDKAPVHQLGLDLWRDCVVRRRDTRERLLLLLLGNVRKERQGEVIDRALMRSITMVRTASLYIGSDVLVPRLLCTAERQGGVVDRALMRSITINHHAAWNPLHSVQSLFLYPCCRSAEVLSAVCLAGHCLALTS